MGLHCCPCALTEHGPLTVIAEARWHHCGAAYSRDCWPFSWFLTAVDRPSFSESHFLQADIHVHGSKSRLLVRRDEAVMAGEGSLLQAESDESSAVSRGRILKICSVGDESFDPGFGSQAAVD